MYFQSTTKTGSTFKYRIINSSSWSNCLSFLEGTGESIQSINLINELTTVIVNTPSSEFAYNISLKDVGTKTLTSYILIDNSFSSVQTWISQQSGKELVTLSLQEKTYVTI